MAEAQPRQRGLLITAGFISPWKDRGGPEEDGHVPCLEVAAIKLSDLEFGLEH